VNNIDMLTSALGREPNNDILAAMLVDELMSERDMLRSEAEGHVRAVQQAKWQQWDLETATRLYSCDANFQCRAARYVRHTYKQLRGQSFTLIIVVGHQPPTMQPGSEGGNDSHLWGVAVTVGASTLLEHAHYHSR